MDSYKFSPIENEEQLMKAIKYTHIECSRLCYEAFNKYLPVAGNIGIFCHYDTEYEVLTKLRKGLTEESDNWNQKYFRLYKPIVIPEGNGVPGAVYTYLYIRHPDKEKPQVGDVDFVLGKDEFDELKNLSLNGSNINNIDIFYRPDLDMVRLSKINVDVLPYITTKTIKEVLKKLSI
ncbi:MAG: hypothetical protein NDI62_01730 [Burkholderiales bacterium]|nr:hypothetical protein [Burkholderiales bacterium]